jgi:hypothetical protein
VGQIANFVISGPIKKWKKSFFVGLNEILKKAPRHQTRISNRLDPGVKRVASFAPLHKTPRTLWPFYICHKTLHHLRDRAPDLGVFLVYFLESIFLDRFFRRSIFSLHVFSLFFPVTIFSGLIFPVDFFVGRFFLYTAIPPYYLAGMTRNTLFPFTRLRLCVWID